MVAGNGPLYDYVDAPFKNQPFPASVVIYHKTVDCISDSFNVIFIEQYSAFLNKIRTFLSVPKPLNGSVGLC